VCPDTESPGAGRWNMKKLVAKADLEKNGGVSGISAFYERIMLYVSELRLNSKFIMQVFDFSPVMSTLQGYFIYFHLSIKSQHVYYLILIKTTWFKRTLALGENIFFAQNEHRSFAGEFGLMQSMRVNPRNCS
jgi:hypothetical protein